MSRLPALKYRDVVACLRRHGFEYLRPGKGSHEFWINRRTGKVEITVQNHGFAVRLDNLPPDLEPTHINLNDQTLEGMRHKHKPIFSVQYHPEASAGPHDSSYLFEEFRAMMG